MVSKDTESNLLKTHSYCAGANVTWVMRVVVATDGSIESDIARTALLKLPLPKGTSVDVAMATHYPVSLNVSWAPGMAGADESLLADTWRIQRQVAKDTVDRVALGMRESGLQAEGVVLEGNTSDTLLDLVKRDKADLVVAGSGSKNDLTAFFMGSVSRKLALYSEASILIGRHFVDTNAEGTCERLSGKDRLDLLIAVDGSHGSDLAIQSLANLQRAKFGTVYVLSVTPRGYAGSYYPAEFLAIDEAEQSAVEKIVGEAVQKIAGSCERVERLTAIGRPSTEIVRVAKEKGVDLVVLGASRHGALERFLLGSCAYETATTAPCSVLILRDALGFAD